MQTETALEASSGVSKGFLLDYGHVVALSILWGLAFVAIRRAEYELAPQNLTILRCLIASAGFITFAPAYGKPRKPLQRKDIPRLLIVSLASVVGHHLSLNYAETIVSSGRRPPDLLRRVALRWLFSDHQHHRSQHDPLHPNR